MSLYPDSANTSIFSQAGLAMCQFEINSVLTGLGEGPTGIIAPGTGRGMGRYIAVKNAAAPNPAAVVVPVTGDNHRFRHQYSFDAADLGLIAMGFGAFNEAAYAAFSGTKVDVVGDANAVGVGTNAPVNLAQATLLFTADAQDADALAFGNPRFVNYFYPGVTVYYLGESMTEVTAADFGFSGIPTQVGRDAWGTAFTQLLNGYTRTKARKLVTHYPLTLHRYVVTGTPSSVTFTLDFSPVSDQTGPSIKAFRWVAATGATEAAVLNSVTIATRSVTVAPASGNFATGDRVTVLYESFDVEVAA